jgi:hypothetical protein
MKAAALFAVILGLTGITASAQDTNAAAPRAGLLLGDKFACSPTTPGATTANTDLLTCMVDHDVKSKAANAPAIQAASKLVGRVQGQKVTWSRLVSPAGISVELDAKKSDVMASELVGNTIPHTLTVHVIRDLASN